MTDLSSSQDWIQWQLVKHQSDIRRGEPRNIGVIAQLGDQVEMRFLGETPDGVIDGKTAGVKGRFDSLENYKRWVAYFHRVAEQQRLNEALARWRERRSESTFFVGDIAQTRADEHPLSYFVERHFVELVSAQPSADESEPGQDRLLTLFDTLGISPDPNATFAVPVNEHESGSIRFEYQYQNGSLHLIDELDMGSRKYGRMTAFDFAERARLAARAEITDSFVAFYDYDQDRSTLNDDADTALKIVESMAHTINLASPTAEDDAAQALGVYS